MPGYWNAHSDRDWEDGLFDPPAPGSDAAEGQRCEDLHRAYAALQLAADQPRTGCSTDLLLLDAAAHLRCADEDGMADEAEAAMCGGASGFGQPYAIDALLARIEMEMEK